MRVRHCSTGLRGVVTVPGDKSISHRAVMLGALAQGTTVIDGFLPGADCLATVACFRRMGVAIHDAGTRITVEGVGLYGLKAPQEMLYVANSGTTMRLLLGLLAGQSFTTTLTGDTSVNRRPMRRVVEPLRAMGADISGSSGGEYAPLVVRPVPRLRGIAYRLPVASAQVKSALLLAGLYADGHTVVEEPVPTRDHTEIMLRHFGVPVVQDGRRCTVHGGAALTAQHVVVPGDISSAAFLLVAALLVPGSEITLRRVGINLTRTGIIDVLRRMGGDIEIVAPGVVNGEAWADVRVRASRLHGVEIGGDLIPRLIDEIPILAVAAAFATGTTVIRDAAELRVKESDRIAVLAEGLGRLGAKVDSRPDGLVVHGGASLSGTFLDSHGDHRMAMAWAVAGLAATGETVVEPDDCIPVSFPGFADELRRLGAQVR